MSHLIERAAVHIMERGPLAKAATDASEPIPPSSPAAGGTASPAGRMVPLVDMEKAGLIARLGDAADTAKELWNVERQLLRVAFGGDAALSQSAPPNLLMVTSARPHEGKSFTAINLAASIARQGDHRVLLIDVDLKRRSLTGIFGLDDEPGLFNCVERGGPELAQATCPTEIEGLVFLPRGTADPRAPNPLGRRSIGRFLQNVALDNRERLVILDVAPCLVRGDASALASAVGQIVLVVEAERTRKTEVESALDLLQDCPGVSLVLNKARHGTAGPTYRASAYDSAY